MGNKDSVIALTVKLDDKNRITIPKWFRDLFKIKDGSVITLKIAGVEVVRR